MDQDLPLSLVGSHHFGQSSLQISGPIGAAAFPHHGQNGTQGSNVVRCRNRITKFRKLL